MLCNLPDSQQHMLCECTDHTTVQLRETILTRLKQHVHQYDGTKQTQHAIGVAFLALLKEHSEPRRLWLGNLSNEQIQILTAIIPQKLLSSLSQPQLDAIFLDIRRILSEGSLNINHRKQLAERFGKAITSNTKTPKVKVKKG